MEKVAFIYGETFIYWSSIILTLAVISAVATFAGLYLWKSKNGMALSLTLPVALLLSILISRWIHWYCLTDSYVSMEAERRFGVSYPLEKIPLMRTLADFFTI